MANGEQVARLRTALTGVELGHVRLAAADWHDGAKVLRDVAAALAKCSPDIREHFGGDTGAAAQAAFDRVHARVSERANQMTSAGSALDDAGDAIYTAQDDAAALEAAEPHRPTKEQPGLDETPEQALNREARDGQRATDYQVELDKQERRARVIVTTLEADYDVSTAELKEIHGDPDPVDDGLGGGSSGGGGTTSGPPTGGTSTQPGGHVTVGGTDEPKPPRPPDPPVCFPPPPPDPPTGVDPEPPRPPLPPTGTTPTTYDPPPGTPPGAPPFPTSSPLPPGATPSSPSGLPPGVAGGLAAGAIGGLAGGAVRGAFTSSAGGTPVRPIGAGGRAGAPGALGRGTAGSGGTRGGAGSAGSPSGRGSRGGAGGRGASSAGSAGGRGRGGKGDRDEKDAKRDVFLGDDGWTDDEGAAPGVID